ncbi:hypothetical protein [Streptomyces mirabilis]|uniref:hypothetical protein n=1 Tax=Streptomyces mirabilis TaxID=68239 RepID=UPI0033184B2B
MSFVVTYNAPPETFDDLSRKIVYSLNPTNLDGTEMRYVQQIAAASFGTVVPTRN